MASIFRFILEVVAGASFLGIIVLLTMVVIRVAAEIIFK